MEEPRAGKTRATTKTVRRKKSRTTLSDRVGDLEESVPLLVDDNKLESAVKDIKLWFYRTSLAGIGGIAAIAILIWQAVK